MADPDSFVHRPVLLDRVTELFATVPAGTVVDVTLGGAGHSAALLDSRPDLRILGIDRDPKALAVAQARLAPYGDRAEAHHAPTHAKRLHLKGQDRVGASGHSRPKQWSRMAFWA